ncbi:MAG: response regulator transcription factor [Gammaproteobacteria bacterium]|nr:response regulator transcription factor [Gammaproteobacteria bacterium]
MPSRIFLIDDDAKLAMLLRAYFSRFDLELESALEGDTGLRKMASFEPDLVILDVMLPGRDGFELCREIRKTSSVPIIMLTARGDVTDRVVGLEVGADDYVPKPFEPRELVARIQTILRRVQRSSTTSGVAEHGPLRLDFDRREAQLNGDLLDLTAMEFNLLQLLAGEPGRVYTRDEILSELRGIEPNFFSRSVDINISRLRQKLDDDPSNPRFIRTIRGAGYVFLKGQGESSRDPGGDEVPPSNTTIVL